MINELYKTALICRPHEGQFLVFKNGWSEFVWSVNIFRFRTEEEEEEEAQCPICLTVMVEGESLVACETGCANLLHHHCMAVWAADRQSQKLPLLCPLCRAPWPAKGASKSQKTQFESPGKTPSSIVSHTRYGSTPAETSNCSEVEAINHRRAYSADDTHMQESGYGTVGGLLPASSVNMNSINGGSRESPGESSQLGGRPTLSSRHLSNNGQSSSPLSSPSKSAPFMRKRMIDANKNSQSGWFQPVLCLRRLFSNKIHQRLLFSCYSCMFTVNACYHTILLHLYILKRLLSNINVYVAHPLSSF